MIFDELAEEGQDRAVDRKLLDIAANWIAFELSSTGRGSEGPAVGRNVLRPSQSNASPALADRQPQ